MQLRPPNATMPNGGFGKHLVPRERLRMNQRFQKRLPRATRSFGVDNGGGNRFLFNPKLGSSDLFQQVEAGQSRE